LSKKREKIGEKGLTLGEKDGIITKLSREGRRSTLKSEQQERKEASSSVNCEKHPWKFI